MRKVFRLSLIGVLSLCAVLRTASNLIAERPILVEAPSGFSTPTLVEDANAKSTSNGIPEPPGDSFAMDQGHFDIGCELCHTSTLATVAPGTLLNGGTYVVSEAIGNKLIHPYSDFLLHELGTGVGIVQNSPATTANKIRTAPLWGLRARNRYLHDGRALTLDDAIREHSGESAQIIQHYKDLNLQEREKLRDFLSSL